MKILLIGGGVIGSVYGAQLGLAGHEIFVLQHGAREAEVVRRGLRIHNLETDDRGEVLVAPVRDAGEGLYDAVIVAVRADQLQTVAATLRSLRGRPHMVFFGNNPDGHAALPVGLPGTVQLGFPGIGGKVRNGVVEYSPIPQQPTVLERTDSAMGAELARSLAERGFSVRKSDHIDGWLAYHTMFIGCIAAAFRQSGVQAGKLAQDEPLLRLMCRAIEEGFRSLQQQGIPGRPGNLSLLHQPFLRPVARRYWRNLIRAKGEVYFAAHIRHAPDEMLVLERWALKKAAEGRTDVRHLRKLLVLA